MLKSPDETQFNNYYRTLALLQRAMSEYLKKYLAANSLPCRDDAIEATFVTLIGGTAVSPDIQELVRHYIDILFSNSTIRNVFNSSISMKVLMLSASGMGSDAMQLVRNLQFYGIQALKLDSQVPETLSEFASIVNMAISRIINLDVPVAVATNIRPFIANGRYAILECIGKGGYGVVHKARDTKLNRHIAVKHLSHKTGLPHEMGLIRDLEREAMSLAGFSHPNIVQVYDFLEDESGCYILMEYADSGTLYDLLAKNNGNLGFGIREQFHFLEGLFEGLNCAHQKGVVHRDIKPSNILICDGGAFTAKLADFGISSCIGGVVASAGTPLYMAPELRSAKQHVASPLVDIYSLGKVIYECLTGEIGLAISEDHEMLAPELSIVLATACSLDPSKRYKTIDEMKSAFSRVWDAF